MPAPKISTVAEQIAWSYANLARAHAAISAGRTRYATSDHMVRAKLYAGLRSGKMAIGPVYDDERVKALADRACAYCPDTSHLTMDHVIPRAHGGQHDGINLVLACRSCNSSKGALDLLVWFQRRFSFPPLYLLRRYLKLVQVIANERGVMNTFLTNPILNTMPMDVRNLPIVFPSLPSLRL